ncbi:MAG: metallophosphoesterase [Candidatus Latescibacterota bacterium]|nr:MAG: metallophosphoesterase [Candidatus Latescibacterota bacterium]
MSTRCPKRAARPVSSATLIFTSTTLCLLASAPRPARAQTPTDFKIAFIADQGLEPDAQDVLTLMVAEGTDAVVHSGDFDYTDNPQAWEDQINAYLGESFPYFASIGNHDKAAFDGPGGYQAFMQARMNRLGISWDGDLGVKSSLVYQGIHILLTGPGTRGSDHAVYIRDTLAQSSSIWRISSWHRCMRLMQVGGKDDDTGWEVYEEARRGGAIVATAHSHTYSRTHLLSHIETQTVANSSDTLAITYDDLETAEDDGATFVFVSGLGGRSIRDQELSGPWWASIYTDTQNATYGALFGTFNYGGDPRLARFYFKNVDGVVIDSFWVRSENAPVAAAAGAGSNANEILTARILPANPVRDRVTLQYQLSSPTRVSLRVFDVRGRVVRHAFHGREHAAGLHAWEWNAGIPPAGVYFMQLETPAASRSVRLVLVD